MGELNEWNESLRGDYLWSSVSSVAREMGIPAVAGSGNATAILKTGDRVRVDAGHGVVEILSDG